MRCVTRHDRGTRRESGVAERSYWLDLFTAKTWDEFLKAGGAVSGFRASQWNQVRQIKPGDILVAYLTGVSRFIGEIEVTSEAFRDGSRIWADDELPARIKVKVVAALDPETAVPVGDILDRFSFAPHREGTSSGLRSTNAVGRPKRGEGDRGEDEGDPKRATARPRWACYQGQTTRRHAPRLAAG